MAETMPLFNSMVSPWHEWVDPLVYRAHVDRIEGLGATTIASAHGPVLTGEHIHHAFDTVRAPRRHAQPHRSRTGDPRRHPRRRPHRMTV